MLADPIWTAGPARIPGEDAGADKPRAWRLQRWRFRPHPRGFSQRRHASLDGCGGDGKYWRAAIAIPAHRAGTAASRPRLPVCRAAAVAPSLEERVRRLQADRPAMAAAGNVRSHRFWTQIDRRSAPRGRLALRAAD